ncbi:50S ribosomal protein L35 [Melia azedarach]|uniref:50S ribosomal protein L35 n=1 Tax=Melia azedarach TaxID=155640 RepID=A0ACC1XDR3_MELAZ|nr:50S ribosomal protein L35 [Melia azedarach]
MASMLSFNLRFCPLCPSSSSSSIRTARGSSVQLATFNKIHNSLRLSSSHSFSGSPLVLPNNKLSTTLMAPNQSRIQTVTVFAAKGYKMKTHKASAKRFRVTGKGKIMRRRAGKQHLLAKKNTKRKLRLSKMHAVSRSDYDNVIGCMPYLKVNRQAK